MPASDLKIKYRKTSTLVPSARNARTHTDEQIAQIAASITEFGFTNPVLIDESGNIIAGHGRVMAAHKLKLATVPTIELTGLDEVQRRAYMLADNKLALNAGWDEKLLALELSQLKEFAFDLGKTGFSELEIMSIFAPGTDPRTEWAGMPEYNSEKQKPYHSMMWHFNSAEALAEFCKLLNREITQETRFMWWPEAPPKNPAADKRYATEGEAIADLPQQQPAAAE